MSLVQPQQQLELQILIQDMLILLLKPIGQRLIVQERTAVVPGLMVVRMIFVQPARVPTKTALEDDTTSETNSASAFSSFLKLPAAGLPPILEWQYRP